MKLFALIAVMFTPLVIQAQQDRPVSYIAVEANSGRVMYSSNSELKRPVGNLAQIATACVALDWSAGAGIGLDQMISVPDSVVNVRGANPLNLAPGERLTLRDALYSSLLGADNASAWTIASYVGRDLRARRGGDDSPLKVFVLEMNRLARVCGMNRTVFRSPDGIEPKGKVTTSTAADMALLSMYAMKIPGFAFIVKNPRREVKVAGVSGVRSHVLNNTNTMLGKMGVDGVKTASSQSSGKCVVISATRDSLTRKNSQGMEEIFPQRAMIVVLGSEERMTLANRLLVAGWNDQSQWFKAGMPYGQKTDYLRLPLPHQKSH